MQPAHAVRDIYQAAAELPEPYSDLSPVERIRAADLLRRFEALLAEHATVPHAALIHPMLLSKNGRHAEALEVTERAYRAAPGWEAGVAVANAARRAGDPDRAAEMFAQAATHDANDVTCFLEVGDIRLEQGRFAEALAAYEFALGREPDHPWAMPSAFYCRHRLGVAGNWLASLREVANQEGCTCGLEGCLTAMLGTYGTDDAIGRARCLLETLKSDPEASVGA